MQGRAAEVRIKTGNLDLALFPGYFCPESTNQQQRNTNTAVSDWFSAQLSALPGRCTPILAGDFNAKAGLAQVQGQWGPCQEISKSIGPEEPDHENFNGLTLRGTCDLHHSALVNTFFSCGPTFWGDTWTSRIDYVAVPES